MSIRYNNDGDAALYLVDSLEKQDKETGVKIVISKQKMQVGREYRQVFRE